MSYRTLLARVRGGAAAKNRWRRSATDGIILLVFIVVAFSLAASVDAFEWLYEFSRDHEDWEIDETITLASIATIAFVIFSVRRVVDLRRGEKAEHRSARTDSLTGLPNRLAFVEHVESEPVRRAAARCELGAIYLDLDNFKTVNDVAGHAGGDILLRDLADRLRRIADSDVFVARVGGDEFNIVVTGSNVGRRVIDLANRVRVEIEHVFRIDGDEFFVTASTGFAVSESRAIEVDELIRRADVAMYHAKLIRTMRPLGWDPKMETDTAEKKRISSALRRGIKAGELSVCYQPIVGGRSRRMTSAEALLRWRSAELGDVPPSTFIPIAEATGLIVEISSLMLRQICRDLTRWPELQVSVNVSPALLKQPAFVDTFLNIVRDAGIDPARIAIELTEGIVVTNPELAKSKLDQLREAGVTLVMDDFGTGFSSIGYLRQFGFDRLKIDRSFVSEVGNSDSANDLLQSFALMSQALDMTLVAEGVETEEQAKLIDLMGYSCMQGYLFGRPMTFDALRHEYVAASSEAAAPDREPVKAASGG